MASLCLKETIKVFAYNVARSARNVANVTKLSNSLRYTSFLRQPFRILERSTAKDEKNRASWVHRTTQLGCFFCGYSSPITCTIGKLFMTHWFLP